MESKRSIVFFIGGNPGTIEFYDHLIENLTFKRDKSFVYAFEYINHHLSNAAFDTEENNYENDDSTNIGSEENDNDYIIYGLETQIANQMMKIEGIIEDYDNSSDNDVTIIGHSIGCYIAMNILERSEMVRKLTRKLIFIMPFILWKNLPTWHRFSLDLTYHHRKVVINIIKYLLEACHSLINGIESYFKFSVSEWLVTYFISHKNTSFINSPSYNYKIKKILLSLYSKRLIDNFFATGLDEIEWIRDDEKWTIQAVQTIASSPVIDKFHLIYTTHDKWAPIEDIFLIKSIFMTNEYNSNGNDVQNKLSYKIFPNIPHAFGLSEEASNMICNEIIDCWNNNKERKESIDPTTQSRLFSNGFHRMCVIHVLAIGSMLGLCLLTLDRK
eukprot:gene7295-9938_t